MSLRTTQRIERNRDALIALHKLSEASKRLPALSKDTLLALVECAKNIIIGNVTLSESQLHYMKRHEQESDASCKKEHRMLRVRILQKGGFLGRLLASIIYKKAGPIIDPFANKIISKR